MTYCIVCAMSTPSVELDTAFLKFVAEMVHFGHIISPNLKDDSDVHKQIKKLNAIWNVLIHKFASNS